MVIQRQIQQRLLRLLLPHPRLHFRQRLAHEKNPVDQQTVSGALDFEVAEESVGAEEGEDFVQGVVGFAVGVNVEIGCAWRDRRERVGGTAGSGAEGEEAEVAFAGEVSFGIGLMGEWVPAAHQLHEHLHLGGRWSGRPGLGSIIL